MIENHEKCNFPRRFAFWLFGKFMMGLHAVYSGLKPLKQKLITWIIFEVFWINFQVGRAQKYSSGTRIMIQNHEKWHFFHEKMLFLAILTTYGEFPCGL